eukprot:TRINITY_DN5912_c0_g1_i2.p1 TRINITY_DN5912_c0_g1~~TRINITY_DN5912_c0_g1_i2.p1  ORF type:complete len:184 (+),score=22.81 TRINITY_DN5912_c0_g1_i2:49-552(+)
MALSLGRVAASLNTACRQFATQSKPNVLVTRRMPESIMNRLREKCDVSYWNDDAPIPRDQFLQDAAGKDGLLVLLTDKIDAALLDAAGSKLKIVSTMSVGYDHVDVAACRKRNVVIGNTPDCLTETTADIAVGLMLAAGRRLMEGIVQHLRATSAPRDMNCLLLLGS